MNTLIELLAFAAVGICFALLISALFKPATRHRGIAPHLLAILCILLMTKFEARAQVTPTTLIQLTNLPTWYTTNATTQLIFPGVIPTTNVISLRQGQGMAASATFTGTNADATGGSLVINWAVSVDGTNYQTVGDLGFTNAANGTTTVVGFTNYNQLLLNNALYITPASIQNTCTPGGAGLTLNNAEVSFGNIVPGGY